MADADDENRVAFGVDLARKLIEKINQFLATTEVAAESPIEPGTVLRAVLARQPDGTPETISVPLIPLLDTALLPTHQGNLESVTRFSTRSTPPTASMS